MNRLLPLTAIALEQVMRRPSGIHIFPTPTPTRQAARNIVDALRRQGIDAKYATDPNTIYIMVGDTHRRGEE